MRSRREELASRFGVKRIGLFGSYARGEASQTSDIDVLVEFDVPTCDKYMDLKFFLEELFGRSVDMVTSGAIKPRVKPYVDRDVTYA